jgi:hypothetical protein
MGGGGRTHVYMYMINIFTKSLKNKPDPEKYMKVSAIVPAQ